MAIDVSIREFWIDPDYDSNTSSYSFGSTTTTPVIGDYLPLVGGTLTGDVSINTGDLFVVGNIYATGDVTALSDFGGGGSIWDDMPVSSTTQLGGIKLGYGLYDVGSGVIDVSIDTGTGDATILYVDGSLALRDTSIAWLNDNKLDSNDLSGYALTTYVDGSLNVKLDTTGTAYDSDRLGGVLASNYARTDTSETFLDDVEFNSETFFYSTINLEGEAIFNEPVEMQAPLTVQEIKVKRSGGSARIRIGAEAANYADSGALEFLENVDQTWGAAAYGFRFKLDGNTNRLYLQTVANAVEQDVYYVGRDDAIIHYNNVPEVGSNPLYYSGNFGKTQIDALNIDADTLDSLNSSQFLRTDIDSTLSATIYLSDGKPALQLVSNKLYLGSTGRAGLQLASTTNPTWKTSTTDVPLYNSLNSNLSTVDWSAQHLTLAGNINQSGTPGQLDINPYEDLRIFRSTDNVNSTFTIYKGNNTTTSHFNVIADTGAMTAGSGTFNGDVIVDGTAHSVGTVSASGHVVNGYTAWMKGTVAANQAFQLGIKDHTLISTGDNNFYYGSILQFHTADTVRYSINSSGNHDFKSGDITTTGVATIGSFTSNGSSTINGSLTIDQGAGYTAQLLDEQLKFSRASANYVYASSVGGTLTFTTNGVGTTGTGANLIMQTDRTYFPTYNVMIGTSTDTGEKLQVSGVIKATGQVTTPGGFRGTSGGYYIGYESTNNNRVVMGADSAGAYLYGTYGSGGTKNLRINHGGGLVTIGSTTINKGRVVTNIDNAGSPQIGFTENGDMSWAIGGDDADNSFKIHGQANSTIPVINGLTSPHFEITTSGDTILNGELTVNDNIYATGEVEALTTSDKRLKTDIKPLKNATEILSKLKPVSFKWNDKAKELNSRKNDDINYGLIAQEVEETNPEIVGTIHDKYKGIDYEQLIGILIKSNQELTERIEKLENNQ